MASAYTQERFSMVYSRAIKIYRATDNRIDLQVKKGDQKKINLTGSTVVFSLVSREDSELVLKKDATADDAALGRFYVILTEEEMRDIEPGQYSYSFIKETREEVTTGQHKVTSSYPLYLDSQYGAEGTIEVNGDVYGEPYDTIEVITFNKTVNFDKTTTSRDDDPPFETPRPNYARHTPISGYEEFFESSIIDAQGNQSTPSSLHTFQVYADSYEGELKLQASLDPGAVPIDENWIDIKTWNLTAADGNFYHNVTGKYNWFRFKHITADNNTGTVDKILYR
jgi:hypothetical protein|tara:strand:- start:232 stop:1077 length:846 start_codon:yes stop_codon:yes gene_type:complete